MAKDTEMGQFMSERAIQISELDFMEDLGDFYCKYMEYIAEIRSQISLINSKFSTTAQRDKLTSQEHEFVKLANWWRDAIVNMKEYHIDKMVQEYVKIQMEMNYWAKSAKAAELEKGDGE